MDFERNITGQRLKIDGIVLCKKNERNYLNSRKSGEEFLLEAVG